MNTASKLLQEPAALQIMEENVVRHAEVAGDNGANMGHKGWEIREAALFPADDPGSIGSGLE